MYDNVDAKDDCVTIRMIKTSDTKERQRITTKAEKLNFILFASNDKPIIKPTTTATYFKRKKLSIFIFLNKKQKQKKN